MVEVLRVENELRLRNLTEAQARADGQESVEALTADLARFYGPMELEQPVTVIWFRPI